MAHLVSAVGVGLLEPVRPCAVGTGLLPACGIKGQGPTAVLTQKSLQEPNQGAPCVFSHCHLLLKTPKCVGDPCCLGLILVLSLLWLKSDWPFALLRVGKTLPRIRIILAVKGRQPGVEKVFRGP